MNIYETLRNPFAVSTSTKLAYILILALLLWATGAPMFHARAANLTFVSDTLSTSATSTLAKHTITFTNPSHNINAGDTIKIQFDPTSSAFSEVGSAATTSDYTISGLTVVSACVGANQATVTTNVNDGLDENVTFTLCPSSAIATSTATTVVIGAVTKLITNPSTQNSYKINLGGTMNDTGYTWVAVLSTVLLTASVDTSFSFTVNAVPSGTVANYATTTLTSTATQLAFGTLTALSPQTMAQRLNVTTDSANGFSVTVQENQPPTSATGATIDLFKDGATTTSPTRWTDPSGTLGQNNTYGHLGLTTSDADLGSGANDFSQGNFVGNFDQPRLIFSHNGVSNGVAADIGSTTVSYRIEVTSLQEAGNDYNNTLWYVATPTF